MAKGRKLTTSRSERYLGSCYGDDHGTTANEAAELGEEDVWSTVDELGDDGREQVVVSGWYGEWASRPGVASNENMSTRGRLRTSQDGSHHVGGLTLAFEDISDKTASPRILGQFRGHDTVASSPRHMATSAPVNIPDWTKILRVDSPELDDECDHGNSEMIPPHEFLAREYARNGKIGGASVFEGVGRTLKGRDMRRVRDAVWSQTGFDG